MSNHGNTGRAGTEERTPHDRSIVCRHLWADGPSEKDLSTSSWKNSSRSREVKVKRLKKSPRGRVWGHQSRNERPKKKWGNVESQAPTEVMELKKKKKRCKRGHPNLRAGHPRSKSRRRETKKQAREKRLWRHLTVHKTPVGYVGRMGISKQTRTEELKHHTESSAKREGRTARKKETRKENLQNWGRMSRGKSQAMREKGRRWKNTMRGDQATLHSPENCSKETVEKKRVLRRGYGPPFDRMVVGDRPAQHY